MACMYVSSKLVLFVTIIFHCLLFGGQLNAQTLFMSMAMLNNVQFTMTQLMPALVSLGVESLVSLKRINEFLLAKEFQPSNKLWLDLGAHEEPPPLIKSQQQVLACKVMGPTKTKTTKTTATPCEQANATHSERIIHAAKTHNVQRQQQQVDSSKLIIPPIMSQCLPAQRRHLVRCQNVGAHWPGAERQTLSGITFTCHAPNLIIICGQVASGKSSLMMALLNELPIGEGTACLSGKLGFASQTAWIFNGTVRENILFGQPFQERRYTRVVEACALIADFRLLECGDLTYISETCLSGGQRARINLARCLYRDCDIYLLDDPFSAIDGRVSEHIFREAIDKFLAGKLILLATHQVKFLPKSDKILLLDEGKQLAFCDYKELCAKLSPSAGVGDKYEPFTISQQKRLTFLRPAVDLEGEAPPLCISEPATTHTAAPPPADVCSGGRDKNALPLGGDGRSGGGEEGSKFKRAADRREAWRKSGSGGTRCAGGHSTATETNERGSSKCHSRDMGSGGSKMVPVEPNEQRLPQRNPVAATNAAAAAEAKRGSYCASNSLSTVSETSLELALHNESLEQALNPAPVFGGATTATSEKEAEEEGTNGKQTGERAAANLCGQLEERAEGDALSAPPTSSAILRCDPSEGRAAINCDRLKIANGKHLPCSPTARAPYGGVGQAATIVGATIKTGGRAEPKNVSGGRANEAMKVGVRGQSAAGAQRGEREAGSNGPPSERVAANTVTSSQQPPPCDTKFPRVCGPSAAAAAAQLAACPAAALLQGRRSCAREGQRLTSKVVDGCGGCCCREQTLESSQLQQHQETATVGLYRTDAQFVHTLGSRGQRQTTPLGGGGDGGRQEHYKFVLEDEKHSPELASKQSANDDNDRHYCQSSICKGNIGGDNCEWANREGRLGGAIIGSQPPPQPPPSAASQVQVQVQQKQHQNGPNDEDTSSGQMAGLSVWYKYYTQTSIMRLVLIVVTFLITQTLFSSVDIYLTVWSMIEQNRALLMEITTTNHQLSAGLHQHAYINERYDFALLEEPAAAASINAQGGIPGSASNSTLADHLEGTNRAIRDYDFAHSAGEGPMRTLMSSASSSSSSWLSSFLPLPLPLTPLSSSSLSPACRSEHDFSIALANGANDGGGVGSGGGASKMSKEILEEAFISPLSARSSGQFSLVAEQRQQANNSQAVALVIGDGEAVSLLPAADSELTLNANSKRDNELQQRQQLQQQQQQTHNNCRNGNDSSTAQPPCLFSGVDSGEAAASETGEQLLSQPQPQPQPQPQTSGGGGDQQQVVDEAIVSESQQALNVKAIYRPLYSLANNFTSGDHAIVYATLLIALFCCSAITNVLSLTTSNKSAISLYRRLTDNALFAKLAFFDHNPIGRFLNRASRDTGIIDEAIPASANQAYDALLQTMATFLIVAAVDFKLALPSLIILILVIVFHNVYVRPTKDIKRLESVSRSPIISHISTTLAGLQTIRATKSEQRFERMFMAHQDSNTSVFLLFLGCNRFTAVVLDWLNTTYISILAAWAVSSASVSGPSAGLIITSAMLLNGKTQHGVMKLTETESLMTSVERVIEYCNLPQEEDAHKRGKRRPNHVINSMGGVKHQRQAIWPSEGSLEYRNVDLYYNNNPSDSSMSKPVLKNLTFKVGGGEKIGIIGRTGAGKSSIITTLFRLYDYQGTILIDGVDIKTLNLMELRTSIGIIPQNPTLFNGSVRENLDPFHLYDDFQLWSALEKAHLRKTICALPGKLDYIIGGGGNGSACGGSGGNGGLSSGQRQLICFARVLLRQNKLIVMDEATADVDPNTDDLIQATIRREFKQCTVITIAHRLETVRDCNRIMILDSGRIVDFDTPEQLANRGHNYFANLMRHHQTNTTATSKQQVD